MHIFWLGGTGVLGHLYHALPMAAMAVVSKLWEKKVKEILQWMQGKEKQVRQDKARQDIDIHTKEFGSNPGHYISYFFKTCGLHAKPQTSANSGEKHALSKGWELKRGILCTWSVIPHTNVSFSRLCPD